MAPDLKDDLDIDDLLEGWEDSLPPRSQERSRPAPSRSAGGTETLRFDCSPSDLPLFEEICLRDGIATFQSQFTDAFQSDAGVARDANFLRGLSLGHCEYGARSCRVYPFVAEIPAGNPFWTGKDVLRTLKAKNFRSEHIPSLDATQIEFPGYNPDSDNDEIHNDFAHQHIFQAGQDEDQPEIVGRPSDGAHGVLQRYVEGGKLWYTLLHTAPKPHEGYDFSEFVILFAVGKSPGGERCVGVVTHQICHNLCD